LGSKDKKIIVLKASMNKKLGQPISVSQEWGKEGRKISKEWWCTSVILAMLEAIDLGSEASPR
jgi:hypothetical protein